MRYLPLITLIMACACTDNQTVFNNDVTGDTGAFQDAIAPQCTPNLDGRITPDEILAAVGVPVSFRVANNQTVDLHGTSNNGSTLWNWARDASQDAQHTIAAEALAEKWYAADFAQLSEGFVLNFDLDGQIEAVYTKDTQGVWLHGLASSAEDGAGAGKTLLLYEEPVQLYRFPLEVGTQWVSTGRIRDGMLSGLPYAGRDTYTIEVTAAGRIELPDLSFDPALQIRSQIVLQPAVGESVSQIQVAWVFECFGEVARATSERGETNPDFTTAAEVRRLAL